MNQILKLVIPFLDFPDFYRCKRVNKIWFNIFDNHLKKHYDVLIQWAKTENELAKNKQLKTTDEFHLTDCCFIQDIGLCLSAVIEPKKKSLKITLATFHRQIKYFQVEIPSESKPYKFFHYFNISWKPSTKMALLDIDKYFFKLDLSNLEEIKYEFIKKSPKTRQLPSTFNNWFQNGKYNAFDSNGKKLLTIKIIKPLKGAKSGINLKYKSRKEINVPVKFTQQVLSFGTEHQYVFIQGQCKNNMIINADTQVQQFIDVDIYDITSFFWRPDVKCLSVITQKMNLLTFRLNGDKWENVEQSKEKVKSCFAQWSEKQQSLIYFEPQLKKINGYHTHQWIKLTKSFHLKIKDIMNLQPGDKLELYHLDRNLNDYIENDRDLKPFVIYPPNRFLKTCIATYTHIAGLRGRFYFPEVGEGMNFEFDIEYNKNHWHPLTNGSLPIIDDQGFSHFGEKSGWNWTQFPKETRIGWRGPMINTTLNDSLPNVYYQINDQTLLI